MTTIVLVRKNNEVVVAGDGQVSMGNTVVKSTASKVRKIEKRDVVAGFAGSTADALTLFERLEGKLEKHVFLIFPLIFQIKLMHLQLNLQILPPHLFFQFF